MAIDTACSSSLVAADAACRDLADDRCDVAVVVAVNLLLDPRGNIVTANAGMLSPTGDAPFTMGKPQNHFF